VREAGVSHDEARRRALATFGGVHNHRESMRDGRGTAWFSGLSLDLKLGFRMLVKYPGLTLIGGLAMAFGIWFGAVTFQMFGMITTTKLPLPGGERIVRVEVWDSKALGEEDRTLYDYQLWRSARSLTDLGAYRDVGANLVGADGGAKPEKAAEITASAFRIAPDRPLLGRVLDESDERAGAAPVVLLGHDVWVERFDRDPRIVGRNVQIGNGFATVVGVMPDGYAFPMSHELWLPLRTDVPGLEPLRGGAITVFGRLAPGMTFESAQAEFTALGRRLAAEHPTTHAQLQPHVLPYTQFSVNDTDMKAMMGLTYFFVVALMVIVCSTVALLLFARAATRETEILVRSALGASRWRIVAQLFAEALVLAGVATVVGLAAAQLTLTVWGKPYLEMAWGAQLPFWVDFNLSPTATAYALALARDRRGGGGRDAGAEDHPRTRHAASRGNRWRRRRELRRRLDGGHRRAGRAHRHVSGGRDARAQREQTSRVVRRRLSDAGVPRRDPRRRRRGGRNSSTRNARRAGRPDQNLARGAAHAAGSGAGGCRRYIR
jgi:hypothetical protein